MKTTRYFLILIFIMSLGLMAGMGNAQQGSIIVPNVEGIAQDIAAQILRTTGLQPHIRNASSGSTIVVQQDPRPGMLLPAGSEVTLITGTVTQRIQTTEGTRTLQQSTFISPSFQRAENITSSPGTVSPVSVRGIDVSSTPFSTTQTTYQTQAVQPSNDGFTILQQTSEAPASQYLMVDARPKGYPSWYPKQFLPRGQSSATTQAQIQSQSSASQITTFSSSYADTGLLADVFPQWNPPGWYYPQSWMAQRTGYYSQIQTQSVYQVPTSVLQTTGSQTQLMTIQTQAASTQMVPVPNLIRLHREDAIFAIRKAGLSVGNITQVQNSQWGAGLVMEQSPRSRAIVQAGTLISLWVSN